ncbi:MAG: galactosyldiacylglycerol synthase [Chloroflexi bacterium]|nr:galactosyldiacylglycerol synthase [Chloroflexota bacterium]
MIQLFDKATDALIGEVSEAQLAFLVSNLEEEDVDDIDYYLDEATLDLLAAEGADPDLISLLRQALDQHGELEFRWEQA